MTAVASSRWRKTNPVDNDAATTPISASEFAGYGPVLELGIGTGRIALPLSQRGVEVDGTRAPLLTTARTIYPSGRRAAS